MGYDFITLSSLKIDPITDNRFDAKNSQKVRIWTHNISTTDDINFYVKTAGGTEIAYEQKIDAGYGYATIPASTLTNGVSYTMYATGISSLNRSPIKSNLVSFRCLSDATVELNITEGKSIAAETFEFVATYSQSENVPLSWYQYVLEDTTASETVYNSGHITPRSGFPEFEAKATYDKLLNHNYKLSFYCVTSVNEKISKTVNFKVSYTRPSISFYEASCKNNCLTGEVDIKFNMNIGQGTRCKAYIKRRKKFGSQDWIVIKSYDVNTSIRVEFSDKTARANTEYEYALVASKNNVETKYTIFQVKSDFNKVFLKEANSDIDCAFFYQVDSSLSFNQETSVLTTFGKKYPTVVSNAATDYAKGTLKATILSDDFDKTGVANINTTELIGKLAQVKNFMLDKKPKVLKDWNGNSYIVMIIDTIPVTYKQSSAMSIPELQFNWVQVGDTENQADLFENGFSSDKWSGGTVEDCVELPPAKGKSF